MPPWFQRLLRSDLPTFIGKTLSTVDPGTTFLPNWHIDLIAEYLEAVRRAEITRLIINLPPRSLKSICVSVAWPAWLLGHDPSCRILATSYAASLSVKHSLDCRLVVTAPWYRKIFHNVHLAPDQNEKYKFMTTQRGFRLATSVGGSTTGEGGNFIIIDDPLSPAQAMNASWRDYTNRWFDHTMASRLDDKRKGVIVLVMQRLHTHDLTGYLLTKGGWNHLCLPTVSTSPQFFDYGKKRHRPQDELLHPERENADLIERAKAELGSSAFAAQYQQQPLQEESAMVRASWLGRYKTLPIFTRYIQSWDTAIKSNPENDASACLTFGELEGRSYLIDARVFRYEYPDLKKIFYALSAQWQPQAILVEDKASGQQLLQDARRETSLPLIGTKPRSDKVTRFAAVSAMLEAGRMVLPEQAPWLADFESELFAFPNAPHDDQVDAMTQYLDWLRGCAWDRLKIRNL